MSPAQQQQELLELADWLSDGVCLTTDSYRAQWRLKKAALVRELLKELQKLAAGEIAAP